MSAPSGAASTAITYKAAEDSSTPSASHWGLAASLCLGALALMVWALRRRGTAPMAWRGHQRVHVEILETRALTPQAHLVVTRYAGRRLLMAVGPSGVQCLRDDPEADAP